jgi:hypothetical protein
MIPASPGLQLPSGLLATADHVKSEGKIMFITDSSLERLHLQMT